VTVVFSDAIAFAFRFVPQLTELNLDALDPDFLAPDFRLAGGSGRLELDFRLAGSRFSDQAGWIRIFG
jgi:hypothetical protein